MPIPLTENIEMNFITAPVLPGWCRVVRNARTRGSAPHVFTVRLLYFVGRPT